MMSDRSSYQIEKTCVSFKGIFVKIEESPRDEFCKDKSNSRLLIVACLSEISVIESSRSHYSIVKSGTYINPYA